MELSIIIVNYNTRPFLACCLAALTATTTVPYEIIIVDNHSTDDSVPWLRSVSASGDLQLRNRGYAAACNQGLDRATGRYLVTMNADVITPPHWANRLIWHLKHHP